MSAGGATKRYSTGIIRYEQCGHVRGRMDGGDATFFSSGSTGMESVAHRSGTVVTMIRNRDSRLNPVSVSNLPSQAVEPAARSDGG